MAAVNYQQPSVNSNFYLHNPKTEPSPPETYLYGKGVYASPMSQTPPSANISPTNLHQSHVNVRQLRQPRQPHVHTCGIAADRSERDQRIFQGGPRAPDTPPASKDNSFDSGKSIAPLSMETGGLPLGGPFHGSEIDLLRRNLSRAASEGLDEEAGRRVRPTHNRALEARPGRTRVRDLPPDFHVVLPSTPLPAVRRHRLR